MLACFRNASAVIDVIAENGKDVVMVCAGTGGKFSLDDGFCVGMLIDLLKQKTVIDLDDMGLLLHRFYNESKGNLLSALAECHHVKHLFTLGFYDDIKCCLETNCMTTVPVFREGKFVRM